MTFDGETIYTELRPHLQRRVLRNEPLARHSTFGVGGLADIWVSLETSRELVDLVSLCSERQWPLLLVGNGTNVLYKSLSAFLDGLFPGGTWEGGKPDVDEVLDDLKDMGTEPNENDEE